MNHISPRSFDVWLAVCLVGALLFAGLRGYEYFFLARVDELLGSYRWGQVPQHLIPAYSPVLITALGFTAYGMWAIGFFGAMIKARDTAQMTGITGHKWSAWAIASIIVPIVGAVVPWLVVGEIRRSIVYSARSSCLDDAWRGKGRFSVATLLVAISVILNVAAVKVWNDIGQLATSAKGVASALAEMPLGLAVISGCLAASLLYLFSTRAFLLSLIRRRRSSGAGELRPESRDLR